MKKTDFLPLGSIIRLQEGTKRIMICGRLQLHENTNTLFDYCACYYPEGVLDPNELFLFNHSDIDEVIFRGYEDLEEKQIKKYLNMRKQQWMDEAAQK